MSKIVLSRWQQAAFAYHLIRDPRVPLWTRLAVPSAIAAYVVSPVDLIPDVLIGLGQVDDLMMLLMAIPLTSSFLRRFAPAGIVNGYLKKLCSRDVVAQAAPARSHGMIDTSSRVFVDRDSR